MCLPVALFRLVLGTMLVQALAGCLSVPVWSVDRHTADPSTTVEVSRNGVPVNADGGL